MFKLDTSTDYLWPCTIQLPIEGGRYKDVKFKARFARLGRDETQALVNESDDDDAFLERVLVGWEGLKDHQGEEIPYTEENRQQLLNMNEGRVALVKAYFGSVSGKEGKQGRRGN